MRGNSKGIPRKNLVDLGGRPLLEYTIRQAIENDLITRVVVSTEDPEIAEHSKEFGAEIPFLRPAHLSEDDTPGIDPILHCLDELEQTGYRPDFCTLLQVTSPFRSESDLTGSIQLMLANPNKSVVSVRPSRDHPAWSYVMAEDSSLEPCMPGPQAKRRQDLTPVFMLNGAFYGSPLSLLLQRKGWVCENTLGFSMSEENSLDIDTMQDLEWARCIMETRGDFPEK